jgi:hypothetical protein
VLVQRLQRGVVRVAVDPRRRLDPLVAGVALGEAENTCRSIVPDSSISSERSSMSRAAAEAA